MQRRLLVGVILIGMFGIFGFAVSQCSAQTEVATVASPIRLAGIREDEIQRADNTESMEVLANRALDHSFERENGLNKEFEKYHPIIETYIQELKPDKTLGYVPRSDHYFLGQADFRGKLKVQSLVEGSRKPSLLWSFNPAGFLQMIFADRDEFDRKHYKFVFVGREFQGEVRCYRFDVVPLPKVKGSRFVGRIWVEDQDSFIVHIKGAYTPAIRSSLKTLKNE